MDLINGKTMYCPECGKSLTEYNGRMSPINPELANVSAYCDECNKYYHWVAYVNIKNGEHSITGFSSSFRTKDN